MEILPNICFQNALPKSNHRLTHCLQITFLLKEQIRCFVSGGQIADSHTSPQKSWNVALTFFTKGKQETSSGTAALSHSQGHSRLMRISLKGLLCKALSVTVTIQKINMIIENMSPTSGTVQAVARVLAHYIPRQRYEAGVSLVL